MANVLTLKETKSSRTWGSYGLTRSGHRVNKSLYDAVQMAAFLADWGPVYWVQGGINAGKVAASAMTHAGLDVGDLSVRVRPGGAWQPLKKIKRFVTWLMRCGVIGFIRGFVDRMTKHLHCVGVPGRQAHSSCKAQIYNRRYGYKYGGAGLGGAPGARWWGPKREKLITWAQSKYNPRNKPKPKKPVVKYLGFFTGSVKAHGYNIGAKSHVKVVQAALRELGYKVGPIDGIKGRVTKSCVNRYLKLAGWPKASGRVLSVKQLQRLIADAEKKRAGRQFPPVQ